MAFFARPFGALFFGYAGDRISRKFSLQLSVIVMALSTFLIGCIPTYHTIGIISIIMLIFLRVLQGFSLGGESTGCFVFIFENSKKYNGFIGGAVLASGSLGILAASSLAVFLSGPNMPDWSWRIAFWLSIFVGYACYRVRSRIPHLKNNGVRNASFWADLKNNYIAIISTAVIAAVNSIYVYTMLIYFKIYLFKFQGYSPQDALIYSNYGLMLTIITVPLMGFVADRVGYIKIMMIASFMTLVAAVLLPFLLENQMPYLFILVLSLIIGAYNGPTPALISSLFPAKIRYTGLSLGYSAGIAIFGSSSPALLHFLTSKYGSAFGVTPFYILVGAVSLCVLARLNKNRPQN